MIRDSKRLLPFLGAALLLGLAGCGKSGSPVAPVPTVPLSTLTVSPHLDTLAVGGTTTFTVAATDTGGNPYAGPFLWTSSDPGVFTVSSVGLVRAMAEGRARLYVSAGGRSDSATVWVFPAATGWVVQTSNASETLNGVFFDAAGRRGWVVGDAGVVLSTNDAGTTWTRSAPSTFTLRDVWFTSPAEGWIVGFAGTVLHTLDGGASWSRLTNLATGENLLGVYFATRDTGWVVGSHGVILGTFDRGATWSQTYLGGNSLNAVMFSGTRDGWAVGDGGLILGSHDAGRSWFIVQPAVTTFALRGLWRRSESRSWAVGATGYTPRTVATADSTAWELRSAGAQNDLQGVCFPTDLTGYAAGLNGTGTLLRTDDGGVTWNSQIVSSQYKLNDVFFVDALRGWAVGVNGTIRHTSSGGR